MDPVSALGIAAAAVQFVDVAWGLLQETQTFWTVLTKSQDDIEELKGIATQLIKINKELVSSSSDLALDVDMKNLCQQCSEVAKQLINALDKLIRRSNKKRETFVKALLEVWTQAQVDTLVKRVSQFREIISTRILLSFRYVLSVRLSHST